MAERYTYNAIAEHPIIPEFDDTEEKFKWNGALLNLSDLPVGEYTKTVFNIAGSVTGETSVVTNAISVNCVNTGDTYEIVATMQYPSDSDITVSVNVEGESEPVSVAIPRGSMSAKRSISRVSSSPAPSVSNPSVIPVKDDDYTYKVTINEYIGSEFKAYYGAYLQKNLDTLDASAVSSMDNQVINDEGKLLKFEIPMRGVEISSLSELENYRYALILAIPKTIYDNDKYSFLEHTFQSPSEFMKKGNLEIGGLQYTVLYRVSDDMQFVSRYMETIEYEFDLKYTE